MGSKWGGEGHYTANQGSERTGIAPRRKGGIPSKEEGSSGTGAGISKQRGLSKGLGCALQYHANLEHIMLIVYMSC